MEILGWIIGINILISVLMYIGKPIVFIVNKIPRIFPCKTISCNLLIGTLVEKEFYNSYARDRILRHEFRHYKDARTLTPLVFIITYIAIDIYSAVKTLIFPSKKYKEANVFEQRASLAAKKHEKIISYLLVDLTE